MTKKQPMRDGDDAGAAMVAAFSLRRDGDGFVGRPADWFGGHLFGGVLIGQAIAAANRTAPDGRRIHSLHTYFLRPGRVDAEIRFAVEPLRDGQSFAQRRVRAWQEDRQLLEMLCSFTADSDGYTYQLPPSDADEPEDLAPEAPMGPWEMIRLGPTAAEPDGTMRSTSRVWLRTAGALPDDPHVHSSVLGLFSDFTTTGGRPLHLEGSVRGLISLDHALWFHRPARADQWLLFDVHALVNAAGRGVLRGGLYTRDRTLVASVAQEMIVTPV